jgi:hypothetical protein
MVPDGTAFWAAGGLDFPNYAGSKEAFGACFKSLQGSGRKLHPIELMDCFPKIRHFFLEGPVAEAAAASED